MGFHEGELAVQERAGVAGPARRLVGMLAPPDLDGGMSWFLAERTLAMITGRDSDGRLWTSPLFGEPGFLAGGGATLRIASAPEPGDPLHRLPAEQPVGLLVIDFAIRRRLRINGRLVATSDGALEIEVDQAYGNCPRFIRPRAAPRHDPAAASASSPVPLPEHLAMITRADTFILGTTHPTRGTDTSHRGGERGFVQVDGTELCWPDYPGNNLFNSLGNLAVDPSAALLFLDFDTGATLHLSGTATIDWSGTERQVRFAPRRVLLRCSPDRFL